MSRPQSSNPGTTLDCSFHTDGLGKCTCSRQSFNRGGSPNIAIKEPSLPADTIAELRLEKGAVVFMKPDSGLIGFGNEQCVSWYSPEIDEFSLYGHNEHYHGYQVSKIISTPSALLAAQKERWEAEARKDELEQRKADYQEYYPIGSGNPYTSQKCIPFTYIDARIAALDGVIGDEKSDD